MLSPYFFRLGFVALALSAAAPAGARATGFAEVSVLKKTASADKNGQLARPTPIPSDTAVAARHVVQLRGVVLTPDGRPCAGASVYPAGQARQLVVTDAQGGFVLPVPAGAALSLQVEYFGVGSSRVAVAAPSAAPLRVILGK